MRLSEQTLHGWDVVVAFEPDAALMAEAVPLLLERSGALIGWIGKAACSSERRRPSWSGRRSPERVRSVRRRRRSSGRRRAPGLDARPAGESWLRLVAGRLGADVRRPECRCRDPSPSTTCAASSPATDRVGRHCGKVRLDTPSEG